MINDKSNRLNKYLALEMGISRREADDLISTGSVSINDQIVSLGARFCDGDKIEVNGKILGNTTKYRYVMLNKPAGYVCSRKAQGNSPTIYDILPKDIFNLKPVGRLDKDSSGLILLSNDGDFAFRMTHPRFVKTKVYDVTLDKDLEPLHQQMIADYGINLEDGKSQLKLQRISDNNRQLWQVTMHEGRNRQIRRTFASLGYTVEKLHRHTFGNYVLDDLKSGSFKDVAKA